MLDLLMYGDLLMYDAGGKAGFAVSGGTFFTLDLLVQPSVHQGPPAALLCRYAGDTSYGAVGADRASGQEQMELAAVGAEPGMPGVPAR
jgi:hypothetical protein